MLPLPLLALASVSLVSAQAAQRHCPNSVAEAGKERSSEEPYSSRKLCPEIARLELPRNFSHIVSCHLAMCIDLFLGLLTRSHADLRSAATVTQLASRGEIDIGEGDLPFSNGFADHVRER